MDGADAELAGGELHDQGHDRVGAGVGGVAAARARPGSCPRSRSGGGRRRARAWRRRRCRRSCASPSGSVIRHSEWWNPSSSVAVANGSPSTWSVSAESPVREGEAPDRVEVGARRAQQLEAVALGLGQRALVGHHVAAGRCRGRARRSRRWCAAGSPSSPVKSIRYTENVGFVVGREHAVGAPLRQRRRRRRRSSSGRISRTELCGSRAISAARASGSITS